MEKSKHYQHGGDLESIEEHYGISRNQLMDFSSNVNPLGISPKAKKELAQNLDLISTYPDRKYTQLRQKIAKYTGADFESILVGNGSTELISLFITLIHPKKSLIIGPTYSEYEREIFLNGGQAEYYPLKETLNFQLDIENLKTHLSDEINLLVICNPNNPTGSYISQKDLGIILDYCASKNIYVMIDETYIEFVENMDEITAVPLSKSYDNMMILRGISKFFSAPGLRFGYGICGNPELIRRMNEIKNPWTINILASFGAGIMLEDSEYISATKKLIHSERTKIYNTLKDWKNIKVYKPCANFVLFKLLRNDITSSMIFEKLIEKHMIIRDASSFPFLNSSYMRFCFLLPEQNQKLLDALEEIIEK
ncbi:pyridoxal phosphate-dependent aminotransferase [Defluviitalea raffinosedens]|uniref:pyridoxal phosphate-dependent aminotransferase n=1 Tax=Defluviitalea raffinosedens TaxID=1450156 RepID=UPI00195A7B8E|nr:histidinol-phosphate transaminase [Defluviitalea raffinosedens]MBM7685927.1 threonine-phosphate decarboxylase [Defluviitalea raffinosedens]